MTLTKRNNPMSEKIKDTEKIIYCTRDSFCMGDDCLAPNLYKFSWYDSEHPESSIYDIIERYLTHLPDFRWRGYSGGKKIIDVCFRRNPYKLSKEITLAEEWRDILNENRTIHFLHTGCDDEEELLESIPLEAYYTFEQVEKLIEEHGVAIISPSVIRVKEDG